MGIVNTLLFFVILILSQNTLAQATGDACYARLNLCINYCPGRGPSGTVSGEEYLQKQFFACQKSCYAQQDICNGKSVSIKTTPKKQTTPKKTTATKKVNKKSDTNTRQTIPVVSPKVNLRPSKLSRQKIDGLTDIKSKSLHWPNGNGFCTGQWEIQPWKVGFKSCRDSSHGIESQDSVEKDIDWQIHGNSKKGRPTPERMNTLCKAKSKSNNTCVKDTGRCRGQFYVSNLISNPDADWENVKGTNVKYNKKSGWKFDCRVTVYQNKLYKLKSGPVCGEQVLIGTEDTNQARFKKYGLVRESEGLPISCSTCEEIPIDSKEAIIEKAACLEKAMNVYSKTPWSSDNNAKENYRTLVLATIFLYRLSKEKREFFSQNELDQAASYIAKTLSNIRLADLILLNSENIVNKAEILKLIELRAVFND